MTEPVKEIRIIVPKKIYDKIVKVAELNGITVNDIVLQAIVKVLDELGE